MQAVFFCNKGRLASFRGYWQPDSNSCLHILVCFDLSKSETSSEFGHLTKLSESQTRLLTPKFCTGSTSSTRWFAVGSLNVLIKTIPSFDLLLDTALVLAGGCQMRSPPLAVVNLSTFFSVLVSTPMPWRRCDCCCESRITACYHVFSCSSRDGSCHKPLWFVPSDWCSKCPRCVPSQ